MRVKDLQKYPFTMVSNEFLDSHAGELGVYATVVYLHLNRFARSGKTFVGIPKIAERMKCSTKTVQRELDALERRGMISVQRENGKASVYSILNLETRDNGDVPALKETGKTRDNGDKKPETMGKTTGDNDGARPETMATETRDNDGSTYKEEQDYTKTKNKGATLFEMPPVPAKERAVPDTPFHQVIAMANQLYELANPGVPCEWSPLAFKRLSEQIKRKPRWTRDNWINCVRFRFQSENINPAETPEDFVNKLPNYASSALNQWGKPMRGGSGGQGSNERAGEATKQRIREAVGGGASDMGYRPDYGDGFSDGS